MLDGGGEDLEGCFDIRTELLEHILHVVRRGTCALEGLGRNMRMKAPVQLLTETC